MVDAAVITIKTSPSHHSASLPQHHYSRITLNITITFTSLFSIISTASLLQYHSASSSHYHSQHQSASLAQHHSTSPSLRRCRHVSQRHQVYRERTHSYIFLPLIPTLVKNSNTARRNPTCPEIVVSFLVFYFRIPPKLTNITCKYPKVTKTISSLHLMLQIKYKLQCTPGGGTQGWFN